MNTENKPHPNTMQVAGSHYKSDYQHWDFVHNCLDGRYLEGNFSKYVARFRLKNGLQDLLKAEHYLAKLMVMHAHGHIQPLVAGSWLYKWDSPAAFCDQNGFGGLQREILVGITSWKGMDDLTIIAQKTKLLIAEQMAEDHRVDGIKAGANQMGGAHPARDSYDRQKDIENEGQRAAGNKPGRGYVDQG